jgi:hypothetical protein
MQFLSLRNARPYVTKVDPMPLSNAERQKRFRERRNEAARLAYERSSVLRGLRELSIRPGDTVSGKSFGGLTRGDMVAAQLRRMLDYEAQVYDQWREADEALAKQWLQARGLFDSDAEFEDWLAKMGLERRAG